MRAKRRAVARSATFRAWVRQRLRTMDSLINAVGVQDSGLERHALRLSRSDELRALALLDAYRLGAQDSARDIRDGGNRVGSVLTLKRGFHL